MKTVIATLFALSLLGGCVEQPDDALLTSSDESEITETTTTETQPIRVTKSSDWSRETSAEHIWPANVKNVQVLLRRGEVSAATPAAGPVQINHLAFVVWDGNTVGRIYRVRMGDDSQDFFRKLNIVAAVRTGFNNDNSWGMAGSISGGRIPPPPPTPGGHWHFTNSFLRRTVEIGNTMKNLSSRFGEMGF